MINSCIICIYSRRIDSNLIHILIFFCFATLACTIKCLGLVFSVFSYFFRAESPWLHPVHSCVYSADDFFVPQQWRVPGCTPLNFAIVLQSQGYLRESLMDPQLSGGITLQLRQDRGGSNRCFAPVTPPPHMQLRLRNC